jgi:methionyl-tRNA formyltransferase
MKLVVVTQHDPVYIRTFFLEFLSEVVGCDWIRLEKIVVNRTFRTESKWALFRRIYPLYGIKGCAILVANYAFQKIWSALPGSMRGKRLLYLEDAERVMGIPVTREDNVNGAEFLRSLREISPDVVLSISAAQIFEKELLALPRLGCVNIHCGKLPEYRGMLPSFWQMYNGEDRITITVHSMGEKIDEGEILLEDSIPIRKGKTLDFHMREAKKRSAQVVFTALQALDRGESKPRPVTKEKAAYFSFPDAVAATEFRRRGLKVI